MLALMLCVRLLWSAAAAALSMRGVVVSADSRLVTKHQVTDLTLDTL